MRHVILGLFAAALMPAGWAGAQAADVLEEVESLDNVEQVRGEVDLPPGLGPITLVKPGALLLVSFDADGDYRISRAEFDAGRDTAFGRADSDSNGTVTLFELEDWREAALGSRDTPPMSLGFDTDFDRLISRDEFISEIDKLFGGADQDENGVITFKELVTVLERRPQRFDERERNRRANERPERIGR